MPKKAASTVEEKSLRQKMSQSVAGSAPSMVPTPRNTEVPAAPKEKETVPKIQDLISDEDDRNTIELLIAQRINLDSQIKPLEKAKDILTDRIKTQLSGYGITQMICDGAKVSYTTTERRTINQNKLIGAGVDIETIVLCTDVSKSSMLKITPAKE